MAKNEMGLTEIKQILHQSTREYIFSFGNVKFDVPGRHPYRVSLGTKKGTYGKSQERMGSSQGNVVKTRKSPYLQS